MSFTAARPAHAATTLTVARAADTAPGAGTCNAAGRCQSLRAAIEQANTTTGAVIDVAAGVYQLTTEPLEIDTAMVINGHGNTSSASSTDKSTVIDANSHLGILVAPNGEKVSISDLRVENGKGIVGGGIQNNADLTLNNVVVADSTAGVGGGVANSLGGALTINGGSLWQDHAVVAGGGIYSESNGKLTVKRAAIVGDASLWDGGGVAFAGPALFDGVSFDHNTAIHGGALIALQNDEEGPATPTLGTVTWSSFTSNTAEAVDHKTPGQGGAITLQPRTGLTVAWSEISSNTSDGNGGGVFNGGQLVLKNDTLAGNVATGHGGALFQDRALEDVPAVAQSLQIQRSGKALSIVKRQADSQLPSAGLDYVTIASNLTRQGKGGGIRNNFDDDAVQIHNTIVSSNGGGNCSGKVESMGSNLDSGKTCGFAVTGDLSDTKPNLGPLQNNGGPTQTMALLSGSPAIDAGDAKCDAKDDQRGVARPQPNPGRCDIGAFEAQAATTTTNPTPTPTAVPSPPVTGTGTGSAGSLLPVAGVLAALAMVGLGLMLRHSRA